MKGLKMNKVEDLKETIEFYENRIKYNEELYDKTDDINFARYILLENEMYEETLESLKNELNKVQGLHNGVTH